VAGTFTACAAAAGYAPLSVAGFRGFNQFAFMGCVGNALRVASTLHLPRSWCGRRSRLFRRIDGGEKRIANGCLPARAPSAAGCTRVRSGLASIAGRSSRDPLEYDFTKSAVARKIDGSVYWGKRAGRS
jgi:hypothetical protein